MSVLTDIDHRHRRELYRYLYETHIALSFACTNLLSLAPLVGLLELKLSIDQLLQLPHKTMTDYSPSQPGVQLVTVGRLVSDGFDDSPEGNTLFIADTSSIRLTD